MDDLSVFLTRPTIAGRITDLATATAVVRQALEVEPSLPIAESKPQVFGLSQAVDDHLQEAFGNSLGKKRDHSQKTGH